MKLAVSATGEGLNALVDPRFGRCFFFVIVEIENGNIKNVKSLRNPGVMAARGAGIQAAQLVASQGVKAVISGHMGPNAFFALSSLGIEIYLAPPGITVENAISLFLQNKLQKITAPTRGFGRGWRFGQGGPRW